MERYSITTKHDKRFQSSISPTLRQSRFRPDWVAGITGIRTRRIEVRVPAEEIAEKIQGFLKNPNADNMAQQIVTEIMKMEEEEHNLNNREKFYETL